MAKTKTKAGSPLAAIMAAGSIKAVPFSESPFFKERDIIPTKLPILNLAFSGTFDGGVSPGLTVFAGDTKTFKTNLGLFCVKAYLDKYEDSICLFYDSEHGTTPQYFKNYDIDPSRVLHIPVSTIEEMKFDMVKRLKVITRETNVIIMVDSLGNLPSTKEVVDAEEGNNTVDMTRAKAIRSLLRIMSTHLNAKDIPSIIINHVYQEQKQYGKTIVSGGTAVMYVANQVFIITKAKLINNDKEMIGNTFTINIEKSRSVKEKSKMFFRVTDRIDLRSGLWEIALAAGIIKEESKGWYTMEGMTTKKHRKDIENAEGFMETLLSNQKFREFAENKYRLQFSGKEISFDEEGEGADEDEYESEE